MPAGISLTGGAQKLPKVLNMFVFVQELAMVRANPRWYIEASLQPDSEDMVSMADRASCSAWDVLEGRELPWEQREAH